MNILLICLPTKTNASQEYHVVVFLEALLHIFNEELIGILECVSIEVTSHGSWEDMPSNMKPHSSGHFPTQTGSLQSLFRHVLVFYAAI